MSEFDFERATWTAHRIGDLWSVVEQTGSERTRYWFGPMKKAEVKPFIARRKAHFRQIVQRHQSRGPAGNENQPAG